MANIAKSFADMGSLYEQVLLNEQDASKQKQTVGKKQDIGTVKLEKKGGNELVKKDLETPKESATPDGKPVDGEKALSQSSKAVTESKTNMKQSLFDKVYKQIVSEDADDFGAESTPGDGLDDATPPATEGDSPVAGEEEVIDPVVVVKEICALVGKLKKHFGIPEDGEEVAAVVDVPAGDGVPAVGEAVDMKEVPDSAGKSLQGKKNDTGGTKVVKSKADGKINAGDGKLEKGPDGEKLAGNKDNKVKGTGPDVKGGNASAFES